jgi:hypothetical protein
VFESTWRPSAEKIGQHQFLFQHSGAIHVFVCQATVGFYVEQEQPRQIAALSSRRWRGSTSGAGVQDLEFIAVSDIIADKRQAFVEKFEAAFHSASGT